ncbi:MAG: hypothetical protein Q9201_003855 [Fulgogasparrea decipioides]
MCSTTVALLLAHAALISLSVAAQISSPLPLQNRRYIIHDCGALTQQVQIALDLGKEPLAAAIDAASQGVAGGHGFQAFFKKNAAAKPVASMLKNIQTMKPIRGRKPNLFSASQPEFVCVDRDTFGRYPGIPRDPDPDCRVTGSFGLWIRGFKYIFICPKFFTLPISTTARHCPRVIDNMFERTGYLLADYQKYSLIHEMVHFYLGRSSLGWDTNPQEMYKLNECVNLDAKNSLNNPENYQYFVAMVEQACTNAPNPFAPPFPLSLQALEEDHRVQGTFDTVDKS